MTKLAIIGGTGLTSLHGLDITHRVVVQTPYGEPTAPVTHGEFCGKKVVFLPRHGHAHTIPPHKVNYRANIWALNELGVEKIIAIAAVGGIRNGIAPGALVIPDQLIDYTWSRSNTFFEDELLKVVHIDFSHPYCEQLRSILLQAAEKAGIQTDGNITYGATQGPRLETAAEINRMERDGCDVVGMTGMPEAALARELGLCYATCAAVANRAAGREPGQLLMSTMEANLKIGMTAVRKLLTQAIPLI